MEKARPYWTTTIGRKRFSEMPFLGAQIPSLAAVRSSPFDEPSWEEQAFAKDSAGHLGGCVWPPRSYSCSFCRREFRSAQALGGHMNVHRKDRAMLKQCSSPGVTAAGDQTLDVPHLGSPSQDVQLGASTISNPNPNSASSIISPRVSAAAMPLPPQEWSLPISSPSYIYSSSIVVRGKLKEYSIASATVVPTTLQLFAAPAESGTLNKAKYFQQRIGGGDLGIRDEQDEGDDDIKEEHNSKRRRIEYSEERRSVQDDRKEALDEAEELDLELRLGDHISQVK